MTANTAFTETEIDSARCRPCQEGSLPEASRPQVSGARRGSSTEVAMNRLEIETSLKRRSRVILALAGSFRANHIGKLGWLIESALGTGMHVTVSLAGLKSADQKAVRAILNWRDQGVRILHCPEYVREWLRTETEGCESAAESVQAGGDGRRAASTGNAAVAEGQLAHSSSEGEP